jgi:hypothetical protein
MVEWLTLVLRIREALGSDLFPETNYPDQDFLWFLSVSPEDCGDSTFNFGHGHFLPHSFQFIINLSHFHLMLYSLSY